MKIAFSKEDRATIAKKLEQSGLRVSHSRIEEVLYNIDAAFKQQFDEEADYMIERFEVS